MNIQSTRITPSANAAPSVKPKDKLAERVVHEARDAYVSSVPTAERVSSGALTSALGSVAGFAAGAGVVAGVAQLADAVIPGNALPVGILWGPAAGVTAAALAGVAALRGGVKGFHGKGGAHTNALSTRESFRESASIASTAAGAVLGGIAGFKAADRFLPQFSVFGGLAGLAAGALLGDKVGNGNRKQPLQWSSSGRVTGQGDSNHLEIHSAIRRQTYHGRYSSNRRSSQGVDSF